MESSLCEWAVLAAVLGAIAAGLGGCGGPELPDFANPPPVDAGLQDASDDDGGSEPD